MTKYHRLEGLQKTHVDFSQFCGLKSKIKALADSTSGVYPPGAMALTGSSQGRSGEGTLGCFFFLSNFIYILIGCASSALLHGLSATWREKLVLSSCSTQVSLWWPLVWSAGSRACGLWSTDSTGVVHGISCSMAYDPPGWGIKLSSPALVGRFFMLSHQGSSGAS